MKLLKGSISKIGLIILFLASCSRDKGLCKKDFEEYVNSSESGLSRTAIVNDQLKITCSYQPPDLLFYGDSTYLGSKEDSLLRFKLSISYEGAHPIDFVGLEKSLSEQVVYSSDWFSIESEDKVSPALFVQPVSYYGTIPQMDYLMVFEAAGLSGGEGFDVLFSPSSKDLSLLTSKYHFNMDDINDIPTLKTGC